MFTLLTPVAFKELLQKAIAANNNGGFHDDEPNKLMVTMLLADEQRQFFTSDVDISDRVWYAINTGDAASIEELYENAYQRKEGAQ